MNLLKKIAILLIIHIFLNFKFYSFGQNIFPGSAGYGTESRGAYELFYQTKDIKDLPVILIVNSNSGGNFSTGANRGTFRWAISQSFPRIIVFEIGGIIDCSEVGGPNQQIEVENPYMCIYGQTAPIPGVTIIGAKLHFKRNHDILVQHLKIRAAVTPETAGKEIDCLGGWNGNDHIIIDHCSFSWSIDELAGFNPANNITFSNCIFAEPLKCNSHPNPSDKCHGMANTFLNLNGISLIGNVYAHIQLRAPYFNSGNQNIYFANNLIYNVIQYALYVEDSYGTNTPTNISVIGNYYKPGRNTFNSQQNLLTLHKSLSSRVNVYLNDNYHPSTSDQTSSIMVKNDANATLQTSNPIVASMNYTPYSSILVPERIQDYSGACFWNRDSIDTRILRNIKEGTGQVIDSLQQLQNPLQYKISAHNVKFPENPNSDDNTDGYTNIQEWVQNIQNNTDSCNNFNLIATIKNETAMEHNGLINLTVSGGSEPYSYTWQDGILSKDRIDLASGNYTIEVTDNNGCTLNTSINVNKNAFEIRNVDVISGKINISYTPPRECTSVKISIFDSINNEVYFKDAMQSDYVINLLEYCPNCANGTYIVRLFCGNFQTEQSFQFRTPELLKIVSYSPNPVKEKINVKFYIPEKRDVSINIFTSKGQRLINLKCSALEEGINQEEIDFSGLSSGKYVLSIDDGISLDSCIIIKKK